MPAQKKGEGAGEREFALGQGAPMSAGFPSNHIRTTKYNAFNFLPLSLLSQFKRYANVYFLVSAVLQSIPQISPLTPISAIAPLIFVIALSMIREAYEDVQRYKSDKETNNGQTRVWRDGAWADGLWRELLVGELVRVANHEFFPADLLLLASAERTGNAFIMTSSLDGERNLKPRFALPLTQERFAAEPLQVAGSARCGPPSVDLEEMTGTLEVEGESESLSAKQLLPRGAELANTEFIVGVVAYTGAHTKLMMNADAPKPKQSRVERINNLLIIAIILVQVFLCVGTFVGAWAWNSLYADGFGQFVSVRTTPFAEGLLTFFSMWVLMSSLVPISLIISLEMVKLVQAFYINRDQDMYDPVEKRNAKAFSSVLNEELGQIEYIFSDKTGTLTSNVMELRHCVVGETLFGAEGERPPAKQPRPLEDEALARLLRGEEPGAPLTLEIAGGGQPLRLQNTAEVAQLFTLTLAACHECVVDATDGKTYLGPSPDEIALVDSARALGVVFLSSTNRSRVLEVAGKSLELPVLRFFAFSSARKRASILVRHEGRVMLLTKGADAIIIERLAKDGQPFLPGVQCELARFATTGLRTLCIAARVLSDAEWDALSKEMAAPRGSPDEAARADALIDEKIERELVLLGCTAVEDRLQEGVPRVIADFISARIRVWMLTGDKLETAENIAYACRLLQPDFRKLYLTKEEEVASRVEEFAEAMKRRVPGERVALLLEGRAVLSLPENADLAQRYARDIFSRADAVVCCRMSPKQKGDIVRLVKRNCTGRTLSIGDGANDANMIQEAHVGIGLYGREGMRAVQASDYALPNFQSLWKLLFVHGRWSYMRIADMILYFYYKNIIFTLPQWFFTFYNAWSAQSFYDDYYITFYNLVFTSWPVIIRAVLDRDIYYREWARGYDDGPFGQNLLYRLNMVKKYYPHLYYVGQLNIMFNFKNLFYWTGAGIASSAAIFWFPMSVLESNIINDGGRVYDLWLLSIVAYTSVVLVVDVKICTFTQRFTWLFLLSVLGLSLLLYLIYFFLADLITGFRVYRTVRALLSTPHFYLCVVLLTGLAFVTDLFYLLYKREVRTPLAQMFRSLEEKDHGVPKERAYQIIVSSVKPQLFDIHPLRRRWKSRSAHSSPGGSVYKRRQSHGAEVRNSNPLMFQQKKLVSHEQQSSSAQPSLPKKLVSHEQKSPPPQPSLLKSKSLSVTRNSEANLVVSEPLPSSINSVWYPPQPRFMRRQ